MDDESWSDADFQKACKFGFTVGSGLVGAAVGSFGSGVTGGVAAPWAVPAAAGYGAMIGLGAALLVCPRVSPEKVRDFLSGQPMPRRDAASVLSALGELGGVSDKQQVLQLAAALRALHAAGEPRSAVATPAGTPRQHAQTVLACLRA